MNDVAVAIVRRGEAMFGLASRGRTLDSDLALVEICTAETSSALDSVDLLELLATLEEEVGLPVLDMLDEFAIETVGQLADAMQLASPDGLDAFVKTWATK